MIATADHQGQTEGEGRKAIALELLEARREACVNRGRRALLRRLLMDGTATADDVRAAVELPADLDPRCLGAVPGLLARLGIIRLDGYAKTARPERHASIIAVWRLTGEPPHYFGGRNLALAWLAAHPDTPDPAPAEVEDTLFDLGTNAKPTVAAVGFDMKGPN